MDQPGINPADHEEALQGLARINALSGSAAILWRPLLTLAREQNRPLSVLDVAAGGGDILTGLARRARSAGIALRLEGCDRSAVAVTHAQRRADERQLPIRFFTWDALLDPPPGEYDVMTTSLFLHHLDEPEAVLLLRRMKEMARHLVLVNDLERGPLGWALAWLGTRLLSRSVIVHIDGPLSVEGAFTCAEVRRLARRAGLDGTTVTRRFPCRFLLAWRPASHRGTQP